MGCLQGTNLDANKMISWTGDVYLEATAPHPGSAVSRVSYLDGWKDMLPEELRKDVSLDRIKVRGFLRQKTISILIFSIYRVLKQSYSKGML
jgi:hypothetical protein